MQSIASQHTCLIRRIEPHVLQSVNDLVQREDRAWALEPEKLMFHACVIPSAERDNVMPPLSTRITPFLAPGSAYTSNHVCRDIAKISMGWCVSSQQQQHPHTANVATPLIDNWKRAVNAHMRSAATPGASNQWRDWVGLRFAVLDMAFQNHYTNTADDDMAAADVTPARQVRRNVYGIAGAVVHVDETGPQVDNMFAMHTPAAPLHLTAVGCMITSLLDGRVDGIFCNPQLTPFMNHASQPWASVWRAMSRCIMPRYYLGTIRAAGRPLTNCPMGHSTGITVACHVCQLANNLMCLTGSLNDSTCRRLRRAACHPRGLGCLHSTKAVCATTGTTMWYPRPPPLNDTCDKHFGPEWTTCVFRRTDYVQTEWIGMCHCSVSASRNAEPADGSDDDDDVYVTVMR